MERSGGAGSRAPAAFPTAALARRVRESPLHAEEELQAVHVVGQQPAFEEVEGQHFQVRDAFGSIKE